MPDTKSREKEKSRQLTNEEDRFLLAHPLIRSYGFRDRHYRKIWAVSQDVPPVHDDLIEWRTSKPEAIIHSLEGWREFERLRELVRKQLIMTKGAIEERLPVYSEGDPPVDKSLSPHAGRRVGRGVKVVVSASDEKIAEERKKIAADRAKKIAEQLAKIRFEAEKTKTEPEKVASESANIDVKALLSENKELKQVLASLSPPQKMMRQSITVMVFTAFTYAVSHLLNINILHPYLSLGLFGIGLSFYIMSILLSKRANEA